MAKFKDISGLTFNSLNVIKYSGNGYWQCKCTCGEIKDIRGYEITHDKIKTCGKCVVEGSRGFKDLTNKQFGDWKALNYAGDRKWNCICSCGKSSKVATADLISGRTKSCGHAVAFNNLKNMTFGQWTVLEYDGDKKWLCRCLCGKEQLIETQSLKRGTTTKCKRCSDLDKIIDLSNQTFGKWTVIDKSIQYGYWECKCICGNIRGVSGKTLRSGASTSCGCNGKTLEQVNTFSDTELLIKSLTKMETELGYKPSSYEVADVLGVNYNSVNRKIRHKEILKELINVGLPRTSVYEKEIYNIVYSMCKDVVRNVTGLLENTRQELDIYIPSRKIAIEFNGNYWHSTLYKDKYYHQQKTIDCAKQGIRLIHIFEYEWKNKREKIIRLLNSVLYSEYTEVDDLELVVSDVNKHDTQVFLDEYNLDGYKSFDVSIALTDSKKEILALMTLDRLTETTWVISKFTVKNGIRTQNGLFRLIEYFINVYKPSSITTYCNLSKFTGSTYVKVGFKTSEKDLSEPSYTWVVPNTNKAITENEILIAANKKRISDDIMEKLGYVKIYDSGNIKLEWR